jgi:hypothetical protein
VTSLTATTRDSLLQLHSNTLWKSPYFTDTDGEPKPFVQEETTLSIYPQVRNYRVLDFEISLLALVPGVRIGGSEDTKGYGGFSVRMTLPEDIRFDSSEGKVIPEETAVSAASWMNISGSLGAGNTQAGILIISLDEGEQVETRWILREKSSMQNPVFPGREPVSVPETGPLVLRYRLVVYSGKLTPGEIRALVP